MSTGYFVPNSPFIVHFESHALKHCQVKIKKDSTTAWLISHQNQSFQTSLHVGPVWNPGAAAQKWRLSSQVQPLSVCMAVGGGRLFWSSVQCPCVKLSLFLATCISDVILLVNTQS